MATFVEHLHVSLPVAIKLSQSGHHLISKVPNQAFGMVGSRGILDNRQKLFVVLWTINKYPMTEASVGKAKSLTKPLQIAQVLKVQVLWTNTHITTNAKKYYQRP